MAYLALYRKYRPSTFDDVYGQDAIVRTLRNQIINQKFAHAYLFYGLRGSGKTSVARILSRAINCENPVDGNPCMQCDSCCYKNDVNPDIIEIDAASNSSVENIRKLIDEAKYKPTYMKYKIYIIDEVHMLSGSAFNALLKTIEEPPAHVVFILCTTEMYKVPDTIKSRCQIFNFKPISKDVIVENLRRIVVSEQLDYLNNDEILYYIASKGDGSMRDSVSILDECVCNFDVTGQNITLSDVKQLFGDIEDTVLQNMIKAIREDNILEALDILHSQYYDGRSLNEFARALYQYYFDSYTHHSTEIEGIVSERFMRILGELISSLERSNNKLVLFEIALIKLCKPEMENDYNSVVQRMNNLEKRLDSQSNKSFDPIPTQVISEKDENNEMIYYNGVMSINATLV